MSEANVNYSEKPKYKIGEKVKFFLWGKLVDGEVIKYEPNSYYGLNYMIKDDINGDSHALSEKDINPIPTSPYGVSYVASAPTEDEPSNVCRFRTIVNQMSATYKAKNADYGDSFGKSIEKYGAIAGLTRISDKFNRLENLILTKDQKVSDEKIGDTLLDLANYAVMLYMAMNCDISDVEF